MYKVSFENNYKEVKTFNDGKVTIVTLTGKLRKRDIRFNDGYFPIDTIVVSGKTVRSAKDVTKDNPILAERIAESKAKIKLYKEVLSKIKKEIKFMGINLFGQHFELKDSQIKTEPGSLLHAYNKHLTYYFTEKQHLKDLIEQS